MSGSIHPVLTSRPNIRKAASHDRLLGTKLGPSLHAQGGERMASGVGHYAVELVQLKQEASPVGEFLARMADHEEHVPVDVQVNGLGRQVIQPLGAGEDVLPPPIVAGLRRIVDGAQGVASA
jgi:hypothetical protein